MDKEYEVYADTWQENLVDMRGNRLYVSNAEEYIDKEDDYDFILKHGDPYKGGADEYKLKLLGRDEKDPSLIVFEISIDK